jgi:hypothetical protein
VWDARKYAINAMVGVTVEMLLAGSNVSFLEHFILGKYELMTEIFSKFST